MVRNGAITIACSIEPRLVLASAHFRGVDAEALGESDHRGGLGAGAALRGLSGGASGAGGIVGGGGFAAATARKT